MDYRVSFFKNLLSSDGHSFKCLQQSIVIRGARDAERAVEAAKRRFERLCHMADWRLYADDVELARAPSAEHVNHNERRRAAGAAPASRPHGACR